MRESFDLTPARPLTPAHAVAAILWTGDGRYLLQHRDPVPTIFYPDHWGFFGGAMEPGEQPLDALRRELAEELAMDLSRLQPAEFGTFRFSVESAGIPPFDRYFFQLRIEPGDVESMRLGEGADLRLVDGHVALHQLRLVPYDSFALWFHYYRGKLSPGPVPPKA